MKVIIAGSRTIKNQLLINLAIEASGFFITEIVSGGARGVDRLGEAYALKKGIPIKLFPAEWDLHGKAAGIYRNQDMAAYADALIAIWDGESRGTANMLLEARKNGLRTYLVDLSKVATGNVCDPNGPSVDELRKFLLIDASRRE